MSTTLIPSMTSTARRRRFDLDVDSGRAMSEWSLGFEVADNGIFVGEETTVVRWRSNHKLWLRTLDGINIDIEASETWQYDVSVLVNCTLTIDNKNVTILVQRALLYESMEKY
ncbi:unnamed protein product [Brassica oleracea]|uniref:(rape) hypothetical protein n=1 Tax=Brassica napus TaxID=3708 RepID=A0A816IAJ4_BRANA|nr:unnamed protein product [Brassica napus]